MPNSISSSLVSFVVSKTHFECDFPGASDLAWVFHRPSVLLHARPNAKVADTEDEEEVLVDDVIQDDEFENRMEVAFQEEEDGVADEDVVEAVVDINVVGAAVPEGVDSKADAAVNHDVPSGSGHLAPGDEEDDSSWKDFQG